MTKAAPKAATASRREQRRAETIDRIERAALQVFVERGFDATTSDQIAAAAGVSVRTFFRHFPHGKDDVVLLEARRGMQRLRDALGRRPPHESALTAIRAAIETVADDPDVGYTGAEAMQVYASITRDHPDLLARMVGEQQLFGETLVESLALRLSADPATDLRPRLLIHAVHAASTVAWLTAFDNPSADSRALLDRALDMLESGLAHALVGPVPGRDDEPEASIT
jgi:AcrR family transcriptional regulator